MTDRTAADLRRQIEQTRHQLGATVEELAAKADVRGRTRARAADLMDRAGAMTVQLRSTASQAGHQVQERASRATDTVHAVQHRATHAGHAVEDRVPAPVRVPVRFAMRHPRPIVIVGAAGVALVAAGWLGRRRARR
jgi:ElaB/YqjD/DUF883 family membrane-anchored ribosome-binding protein